MLSKNHRGGNIVEKISAGVRELVERLPQQREVPARGLQDVYGIMIQKFGNEPKSFGRRERLGKNPGVRGDAEELVDYRPGETPGSILPEVPLQELPGLGVLRAGAIGRIEQNVGVDQKPHAPSIH